MGIDESLKLESYFRDKDTLDVDKVVVHGYNRTEIMDAIKFLLTETGIEMYGRKHCWKLLGAPSKGGGK